MKHLNIHASLKSGAILLAAFSIFSIAIPQTKLTSPIQGSGYLTTSNAKFKTLTLQGKSGAVGDYSGYAQITFGTPSRTGEKVGTGVAVFRTSGGNQIVSNVRWVTESDRTGQILFTWAHSVKLNDGTVQTSSTIYDKTKPNDGKGKTVEKYIVVTQEQVLVSTY